MSDRPIPLAGTSEARWFEKGRGCTLLSEGDPEFQTEGLDVSICCTSLEWEQDLGGYIHYLEPEVEHQEGMLPEDEDPDLVTLDPRANTLCLVLREAGIQR